jgi:hypothetical protein
LDVLLVLLGLLAVVASRADTLDDPSWTRLSSRPTETDLGCAGYDHEKQWTVTLRDEGPVVTIEDRAGGVRESALPFPVPKHPDRSGDRHVLRVAGGWVVGFDAGEFGGGLWFTADGSDWRRLRPAADAPSGPEDPFGAENVQALVVVDGHPIVLTGLDHLTGRSGRVFALTFASGQWSLRSGSVLDSSPEAWAVLGGHLEVVTDGGLWQVRADGSATLAVPLDFGMAFPRSLVITPDGRRYIGMRRYVLMLQSTGSGWRETWFGPTGCLHSRATEYWECTCAKDASPRPPG